MKASELKAWVDTLPPDAEILVHGSSCASIPIPEPSFMAIAQETVESPIPGFEAGKVISSFPGLDSRS